MRTMGDPGDQPVVGDFDRDGTDTIGVFRNESGGFGRMYFSNLTTGATVDGFVSFGAGTDIAVTGDWDGWELDGYCPR
jgi:hypothetical protein